MPRHKHVRVILTAGLLESFDDAQAAAVQCDGILKKPFEASVVMETLKPLVEAAHKGSRRIRSDADAPASPASCRSRSSRT